MGVQAHWIIAGLLSILSLLALGLYMQLDKFGGEILLGWMGVSLPLYILWGIVRKNDNRIHDKLKNINHG